MSSKKNNFSKLELALRKNLQKMIDAWHIENKGNPIAIKEYKKFLIEINFLMLFILSNLK